MELRHKLKRIREKLDIPQKALALDMKCSTSLISRIEKGNIAIANRTLESIRKSLDIADVPLTAEEVIEYEKKLYEWRDAINDGRMEEARNAQPRLARSAELSFEPNLQILYTIISASYFRVAGDNDSADKALEMLADNKDNFSQLCLFRYYTLLGSQAANAYEFKTALKYFLDAEQMGENLNIVTTALYYNIAVCFKRLNYIHKSQDYIMKARKRAEETNEKVFEVYYDSLQALNYNEMGKQTDALDLLLSCLRREKKMDNSSMYGTLYHNIGCIHLKLKDYDTAIEYFNQAFDYCKEGGKTYLENLYFKIITLYAANKVDDAKELLDIGLEKSAGDGLFSLMFGAIKHSQTLNNAESLSYIEDIVIPGLLTKGFHLKAIKYCDILRDYFNKAKKYKHALKYSMMSQYCYKEIMEGSLT